jgi:uncharacterized delta-60 repeat protein
MKTRSFLFSATLIFSVIGTEAQPGAVDPTFNSGGTGFDAGRNVSDIDVQPDGRILVCTGTDAFYNGSPCRPLLRLLADGSLDPSFNLDPAISGGNQAVLRPDGRIFLSTGGAPYLYLVNQDGSLNNTFVPDLGTIDIVSDMSLQPDGRLLVCSRAVAGSFSPGGTYKVARLYPDGTQDPSFIQGFPTSFGLWTVGLDVLGRIYVGGFGPNAQLGVTRLSQNGSIDPTYALVAQVPDTYTHGMLVQPDGMVITDSDPLRRILPDGTVDGAFAATTMSGNTFDPWVGAIAQQTDGKVVIAGRFTTCNGAPHGKIARLHVDGTVDAAFNAQCGGNINSLEVFGLAIQADGKILAGGNFSSVNGNAINSLVRLLPTDPVCSTTALTTTADPVITCGLTNVKLNGSTTLYADPMVGANRYRFSFTNVPGQVAYSRNITSPTRALQLFRWATLPLKKGRTYRVTVQASFNNGATWCPVGATCTITISNTPNNSMRAPEAGDELDADVAAEPALTVYPNPNHREPQFLDVINIPAESGSIQLRVFDAPGRVVLTEMINGSPELRHHPLNLPQDLPSGIYSVQVSFGDQVLISRIVRE